MTFLADSMACKNARLTAVANQIGSSALITIFSGSPPASPDSAATGTSLVVLTGAASGFGTIASGVLTANAVVQGITANTGTAGYCRISTSGGTPVIDADVGVTGGNAIVQLNSVSLTAAGPVQISSATFSEPGVGFA